MRLLLLDDLAGPDHRDVRPEPIQEHLEECGYCLLGGLDEPALKTCLVRLGRVINVTDVTVRDGSRALVTSRKALSPHTDHHKADLVAWYCHAQCDDGGETLLVDGRAVYEALEPEDRRALEGVLLKEHKVFPDDPEAHPLAERVEGRLQLYYSYWLLRDEVAPAQAAALDCFRSGISRAQHVRRRLAPGEALIVENRRILHGRTEIHGSSPRLMRRYWIATGDQVGQHQGGEST